jgi:hypothetical protein
MKAYGGSECIDPHLLKQVGKVKVNLSYCLIKLSAMKTYNEVGNSSTHSQSHHYTETNTSKNDNVQSPTLMYENETQGKRNIRS